VTENGAHGAATGRLTADSNDAAAASATNSTFGVPPLRIHHLIIWMAVTAAVISGCMWFERIFRNGPPIHDQPVIAGLIATAICVSAALTCSGFAMSWRRQGHVFPQSPGDFLLSLVTNCVLFFCAGIAGVFVVFFVASDDDPLPIYYFVVTFVAYFAWTRMTARGFARFADTGPWRVAFWLLIVLPGVILVVTILANVQPIFPVAILVACLLWAMFDDVRARKQRSWTHWLGCFTTVALGLALAGVFHR
jgi:hypothetical protein